MTQMPETDEYELEVLSAFEKGQLKSAATKSELAKFKAAARATSNVKNRLSERSGPATRATRKPATKRRASLGSEYQD